MTLSPGINAIVLSSALFLLRSTPANNTENLFSSIKTNVGKKVKLDCFSDVEVTWEREEGPLPKGALKQSNSLVLSKTTGSDSGTYICKGSLDNVPFLSKIVLKVLDQTKIKPVSPKIQEEENITLECFTRNSTEVVWKFNGKYLPVRRNKLLVLSAQYENQGYYECIGKDKFGVLFFAETELIVAIKDNLNIYPAYQRVNYKRKARFHCISDSPVLWRYEGGELPKDAKVDVDYFNLSQVLAITYIKRKNSGVYSCEGSIKDKNYHFIAKAKLGMPYSVAKPLVIKAATSRLLDSDPYQSPFRTPNGSKRINIAARWPGKSPIMENSRQCSLSNESILALVIYTVIF